MEINKPAKSSRLPDPLVDEVRAIRGRISAVDGHNLSRHVEKLREIEREMKDRVVQPPVGPPRSGER